LKKIDLKSMEKSQQRWGEIQHKNKWEQITFKSKHMQSQKYRTQVTQVWLHNQSYYYNIPIQSHLEFSKFESLDT